MNNDGSFTHTPEDPNFPTLDELIYRLRCLTTGQEAFASVTLEEPASRCLWVERQGVVLLPLCLDARGLLLTCTTLPTCSQGFSILPVVLCPPSPPLQ